MTMTQIPSHCRAFNLRPSIIHEKMAVYMVIEEYTTVKIALPAYTRPVKFIEAEMTSRMQSRKMSRWGIALFFFSAAAAARDGVDGDEINPAYFSSSCSDAISGDGEESFGGSAILKYPPLFPRRASGALLTKILPAMPK